MTIMKKYLCLIIFLNWMNSGFCQIERQWSSALDTTFFFTDVIAAELINGNIVFQQINYDEDFQVLSKELKIHESVSGNEIWRFSWSDYPMHANIAILPLKEDQVYFVVNDSHLNGMDYYGVLDLFGEVVWQDSLLTSSLINVSKLEDKLLMDISEYDQINKLLLVDENGIENWILEDGNYDSWNRIFSNGSDKAIWLNNNGIKLIDASSQVLGHDSITQYLSSYSHFELLADEAMALSWSSLDFILKKYSSDFQSWQIDTLNYSFDIFGVPNPTIISQPNGNTFVESDFTYEGNSFIAKYNANFENQWVMDSEDDIINVFPETEEVILVDLNSINVLSNTTGELLYDQSFETEERVLKNTVKSEIYDAPNKTLYIFTHLNGTSFLNKFKLNTTNTLNLTEDENLNIFPVPVTDRLYLENIENFKTANVYDISGRFLFNTNLNQDFINTEALPKATYILQVINESKTMTAKFIKM